MASLRKKMEQHLFCQCKHCQSKQVFVSFRFVPNILSYPLGLGGLTLIGIQPVPIKLRCRECQRSFFASGIHH
ncbi:hypothetical protein SHPE106448_14695 [Shewanella pealeana]